MNEVPIGPVGGAPNLLQNPPLVVPHAFKQRALTELKVLGVICIHVRIELTVNHTLCYRSSATKHLILVSLRPSSYVLRARTCS